MTWVDVASATLPEETVVTAHVGERQVVVARVADAWYSVDAWCSHAECPLGDGWVEGSAIRCACHGALFDLATGEPVEGPAHEPIEVFRTRVENNRVEVET